MCPRPCLGSRHGPQKLLPCPRFSPVRAGPPADRVKGMDLTRGLRRTEYTLFLAAVLLVPAGAAIGSWWLVGAGAWALIAGGVIEMIYRP